MTNPDEKTPQDPAPNAPSWVDEVLGGHSATPAAPADLRIPESTPRAAAPSWVDEVAGSAAPVTSPTAPAGPAAPSWVDDVTSPVAAAPHGPQPQPVHHVPPAPVAATVVTPPAPPRDDDWVTRATGGARNPTVPQGPATTPQTSSTGLDDMERQARQAISQFSQGVQNGDVAQKKLIAGLLAIFLGSLGVHKFYLGNTTPGLIMLGATIGGWILGVIGSFIIVGAVFFLVPMLVSLLGLVEGIIYLTKSDADFQREYVTGKKAWL
ncbi:NINE protein [Deinococcus taeanensis]|uniref:TM2 domain-containing protein n=1 Tax=Deinococcus taeanensis TaxID=2737050 RepID=UPI001CDD6444|nr:TM2 domain-containing protein [Deinococcus taeanensis]UBV42866.1 NINE protein [Deinococcus taeanensis]